MPVVKVMYRLHTITQRYTRLHSTEQILVTP